MTVAGAATADFEVACVDAGECEPIEDVVPPHIDGSTSPLNTDAGAGEDAGIDVGVPDAGRADERAQCVEVRVGSGVRVLSASGADQLRS